MQFFYALLDMLNITATVQAVSIDYPGILLFEDKDLPGFPSKNSSEYEQELINWGQIYKLPITPAIAKEIINKSANADQTIWQTMRDVIFVETLIKSINHLEGDYINKISTKDYTDSYAEKTYDRLNEVVKIWQNYDDFWNKAHSAMTNLILIHSNEKFYKEAKEKVGFLGSFAKGDLISPVTGFIQDKAIDFLCYGIEDLCSYTLKIASIKNAAGLYSLGTSLITDAIISFGIAQLESRPLGKFFALYYYTLKYKPELISSCPKLFLSDGTINKEEAQLEAIDGSCSNKDSFIMALLRPQTMTHTIDVGLVTSENAQMMRAIATSFAMLSQLRTLDTIKKEIVGYAYLSYLSNTMTYQQYIDVNDCEKIESGVTSNLQMHIPLIEHNGQKFWADFEAQTLGSDLYFSLKSYGTANIIITQCSQAATLSPSFLLHVPVARFGEQTLWADLQYIGNNLFKVIQYGFATVSAPTFNAVPSSPVVSPTTQTWKSTPQTIQVSANNAERIYCTLRTTDDGSEPAEPPEPTKESGQHDPCSKIEDSIKGNKGNFEFWGSSGKVKKIKVRFRGFNNQGYGVTSSSYQYTIDLRSSQATVPTIPTPSQTTGSWTTTPQFLSVSANNAEKIYCMVEETNDGTIPNDPPIPSETQNDPCVQGGSFISGASGQFQLWGETGKLENIKIRFRAWNQQGFSSVSPVYNYSIDLRAALKSGSLDPTFGTNGISIIDTGSTSDNMNAIALQPDGKIILVGSNSTGGVILRLNQNGTLDSSFGNSGKILDSNYDYRAVTIQKDGKIIVGGERANMPLLRRYNPNGSIDTTFGINGEVELNRYNMSVQSIAIQEDGKILISIGGYSSLILRYTSDGKLDEKFTFQNFCNYFSSIFIQNNGKIVTDRLARYNSDGSLDSNFANNGCTGETEITASWGKFRVKPRITTISPQDNKFLVTAFPTDSYCSTCFPVIMRYDQNGILDSSFGNNGIVSLTDINSIDDIKVQNDGKILIASSYYDYYGGVPDSFMVVRYNVDGSLDTSFGENGKTITTIYPRDNMHQQSYLIKLAIQSDGKIIGAGYISSNTGYDFVVVRYLP